MSKYKVLTDGNGSGLIQVVGMGFYMPIKEHQAMVAECEYSSKQLADVMQERDAALAREAELVAQVEVVRKLYTRLTNNVEFADNGEGCYVADGKLMSDFDKWSDTTPAQHLRDIQADAGRAGVFYLHNELKAFRQDYGDKDDTAFAKKIADIYAKSVKAGE